MVAGTVLNLSRRSWQIKPGTGEPPVRGLWKQKPKDLVSLYQLIEDRSEIDVLAANATMTKELLSKTMGEIGATGGNMLRPWTTAVLAEAGGRWGPAAIMCFQDPTDEYTVTFMLLNRPGYNYCAGVSLSRNWIGDKADGSGEDIYDHIENVSTDQCKFSDGPLTRVTWRDVAVTFTPQQATTFTIEDA